MRKICGFLTRIGILSLVIGLNSCVKSAIIDDSINFPNEEGYSKMDDNNLINGYPDKQSYFPGDSAKLFLSTKGNFEKKTIRLYNLSGKEVYEIKAEKLMPQDPHGDAPYENGFGYVNPISLKIPELKSGIYLLAKKIPLVIKSKAAADITIVYCSNTENAYCTSGRRSLYTIPVAKRVSFLRPIPFTLYGAGFLEWMEKQNYSCNVIADIDMDDYKSFKGKLVIIPGHNEYWTRKARRNFDRFIDEGHHALILSGNTMWWQISYNEKRDQIICYKYLDEPANIPDSLKTITWPEALLNYQPIHSIGCDFNRGGYGNNGQEQGWHGFKVLTSNSPLFAGLNLKKGDLIPCRSQEYDGAPLRGFDKNGDPIVDEKLLGFHKIELTGFDHGFRYRKTVATSLVMQKHISSGIIVNFPSTDWCKAVNFTNGNMIPVITKNAIDGLIANKNMFSK